MANGSVTPVQQNNDALAPPSQLSKDEKWIVRLHGMDMGPFSSQSLYPKLLTGEIDPETMLLDQAAFSRCRLREIPEFNDYLHLYNTQNPILLEEQRQQEREEYWETKGRNRALLASSLVVLLLVGGFVTWRVFFYKSQDVLLSDGDFLFSMQPFVASKQKKKKKRNWAYNVRRRVKRGKKGSKKGTKQAGPSATSVDFTSGAGGDGIPREKLKSAIGSNIRTIFGCFKSQLQRDPNFTGGNIIFRINGTQGRIVTVKMDTDRTYAILSKCVRRRATAWTMPTFNGNAVIHYPVYVRRKSRW